MRVLVTGGTGFVGSNLAQKLVDLGHEVVITGTKAEQAVPGARFLNHHLNGVSVEDIGPIDVCFHQAANNDTLDKDMKEMFLANVFAPRDFIEKLIERGCKNYVYASSTAVFGNSPSPYTETTSQAPTTNYALSKSAFEVLAHKMAKHYKVNMIGLRYCNVYGPGEIHKGRRASMIHQLCLKMLRGERPKLFEFGTQSRDWCYIEDVVAANVAAWRFCEGKTATAHEFNIGSGSSMSFNRIMEIINAELGTDIQPEYIPNPIKDAYQEYTQCNISHANALLDWQPQTKIEDGIVKYLRLLRSSL